MKRSQSRRRFLKSTTASTLAGGLLGSSGLEFLNHASLRPISAEETQLDPKVVRLQPEIEPLVRLLEDTPRNRLLEEVGQRIKKGVSYKEILAALLLAGVRNVQPRPAVGFKFHSVLVVNSAHLASMSSPDQHRWLPIFWALDYFKSAQARDVQEGNWTMGPVDEGKVPQAHGARKAFQEAMANWDVEAADTAIAGFSRTHGMQEVFEEFFKLGARDFRSIGHKIIFVSNAWRTLSLIGQQHAEPVLRSLAYALLQHEGDNPQKRDDERDRPGRLNLKKIDKICAKWAGGGKKDPEATNALVESLSHQNEYECSDKVAQLLEKGVHPQSIWDALFQVASDQVLRKPGIISLHTVTTLNAINFAFQTTGNTKTRAFLLLQAASFVPLFRKAAISRGGEFPEYSIAGLNDELLKEKIVPERAEIFDTLGSNHLQATLKAYQYLNNAPGDGSQAAKNLIHDARVLVFLKGNDAHDYKYSSACLEDYFHLSPAVRNRYLAACLPLLQNSKAKNNPLVKRTQEAFKV